MPAMTWASMVGGIMLVSSLLVLVMVVSKGKGPGKDE